MANAQPSITKTVRYGVESPRGTGVPCTAILDVSDADWEIDPPLIRSANLTGGVYASPQVTPGVIIPRLKVKLGSLNWDKFQRILSCALDGSITAAGASADKTWATNAIKPPAVSTGAAITDNLKSLTLEFGFANPSATQPAHKMVGALVERIKLMWTPRDFVSAEVDFVSISAVTDLAAYSGTLSPDTMSAAVPDYSMFKAFIDASGGTMGATADATIVGAELEWKSFIAPDDNGKRLTIAKQHDWTCKLTRFHEDALQLANARTMAEQKIRVGSLGPVLGSSYWTLYADLYGFVDTRTVGNVNGFVTEELTIAPRRDVSAATDISFNLVNSVAVW